MIEERRTMRDTISKIERLEKKAVNEALAAQSVDGAPISYRKIKADKAKKRNAALGYLSAEGYA